MGSRQRVCSATLSKLSFCTPHHTARQPIIRTSQSETASVSSLLQFYDKFSMLKIFSPSCTCLKPIHVMPLPPYTHTHTRKKRKVVSLYLNKDPPCLDVLLCLVEEHTSIYSIHLYNPPVKTSLSTHNKLPTTKFHH